MAFGEPLERRVVELAQQDAAAANRRRPGGVTVDVADLRVRDVGDGVRTRPHGAQPPEQAFALRLRSGVGDADVEYDGVLRFDCEQSDYGYGGRRCG